MCWMKMRKDRPKLHGFWIDCESEPGVPIYLRAMFPHLFEIAYLSLLLCQTG